jgi:hypothetical protein
MNFKDIRNDARYLLKGNWLNLSIIVLVFNLYLLFVFMVPYIIFSISSLALMFGIAIVGFISTIFIVPFIYGLFETIVKALSGNKVRLFEFVSTGTKNFKRSYFILFGIIIKLAVPILAFIASAFFLYYGNVHAYTFIIVTGAIIYSIASYFLLSKAFYYFPAYFIMAEDENKSIQQVLNESKEIMTLERFNLLKLIGLFAIFFGVMVGICYGLGILFHSQDVYDISFTVGYLLLFPYFIASLYVFYRYKKDPHYKYKYEEHLKDKESNVIKKEAEPVKEKKDKKKKK